VAASRERIANEVRLAELELGEAYRRLRNLVGNPDASNEIVDLNNRIDDGERRLTELRDEAVILVVVEIIFIPGTTVVGIIGFCMMLGGIVVSFNYFGQSTGWLVMGGAAVVTGIVVFLSLRTKAWERFSLKDANDSKVNEGELLGLSSGEEGITVSSLRPSGKADINGKLYEVTTLGNFVSSGTKIKIIRISSNQVIVEPLN
jgi:membrane-bound ClpP family serine protease